MAEAITTFYFAPDILNFLSTTIVYPIDYWYIIHFISGVMLFYLLKKNEHQKAILILIIFEVFEFYLYTIGLARKETTLNRFLDIILGYLGYYIMNKKDGKYGRL